MVTLSLLTCVGCRGPGRGNSAHPGSHYSVNLPPGSNVLPVEIDDQCGAMNRPCASVTICVPGTNDCQTIDHLLIDTGSFGLRVYDSVLTLNLPAETDASGKAVAECVSFVSA